MPSSRTNPNVHGADVPPASRRPRPALEDTGCRSLQRGLAVLDAVQASGQDGVRVVDLCRATGLERATVYRLLGTLLETGHVMPLGRFRYLAGRPLAGAAASAHTANLAVRLQPVLARVSAACGDASFAIVREGSQSQCIARQVGSHPVQMLAIQVGTRQPLGVGSAGLALLSALPDEDVDAVIAANAAQLPSYGGMTPERLRLLVRATRERGWSVVGNHATQNMLAVGLPVRDARGTPIAAISVATTEARMTRQRQQDVARSMRQALAAAGLEKGLEKG